MFEAYGSEANDLLRLVMLLKFEDLECGAESDCAPYLKNLDAINAFSGGELAMVRCRRYLRGLPAFLFRLAWVYVLCCAISTFWFLTKSSVFRRVQTITEQQPEDASL